MATLIPPSKVIRAKRSKSYTFYNFKWHLIEPTQKRKTVCNIVLIQSMPNPVKWEVVPLEFVKSRDICKICLGGMVAKDIDNYIDPQESKYYIAFKCGCYSAIVFTGKEDLNKTKTCFYCNRKWKMIDIYGVEVVEIK